MKALIVYISDVSGHRQAARAIKQAFKENYPELTVEEVNLFRHGNPFMRFALNSLYYAAIKVTPWLWNLIWDSKEIYWLTYLLRIVLYRMNYHRLYRNVIKIFDPQVVICTNSLSCAICSAIKQDKRLNYLIAAVPTDLYLNPYWFYKNVDIYFLPRDISDFRHVKKIVPSAKLQASGIPISPDFSKPKDIAFLKKKWQIEDGLFTILIMGGGQGWGAIENIVLAMENDSLPLQVIAVAGTNRKLKRRLCKLASKFNFPFKVCGYVRQMDELMEVSDLLITKPGGLTTAEALSKALPMIVVDSIAGQERRNKKFLLEKGLAFDLNSAEEVSLLIRGFIENGYNRKSWREKTKIVARPHASREIAQKIMDMLKKRQRSEI